MKYVIILLFTILIPAYANACVVPSELDPADAQEATAIFSGEVVGYEKLDTKFSTAKLTFKVNKVYKGSLRKSIDVIWQNSSFGVPRTILDFDKIYNGELTVALINSGIIYSNRAPTATIAGLKDKELAALPQILQSPCSPPFIFTKEQAKNIDLGIIEPE